jgi:subtilase family serine protease
MKAARLLALTGSMGLAVSFMAAAGVASASTHPSAARVTLRGSALPASARTHPDGKVAASSSVSFNLSLKLRNAAGAARFAIAVSTPHNKSFHHYLTDAKWEATYGPSKAEASAAVKWLKHEGFKVGAVAKDRLFVSASGPASRVEKTFGVQLGYYMVTGHKLRLAKGNLSIPASMAGTIGAVTGVSQVMETTSLTTTLAAATKAASKPRDAEPGPPAGFRNPQPCAAYWGQKTDTADSASLYAPYTNAAYDICGYKPGQLRSAYGLAGSHNTGRGVTVAIVDAYDSPTLETDAQHYFHLNDPAHPLRSSQFTNIEPATVDDEATCGGSGWYPEQALDVESVHTMAPGAHINFVGAQDCFDTSLMAALNTAVTSGASVVSDSYGDTLGDLFEGAAGIEAWETVFELADSTGVSVLYSSGDDGDNFADFGIEAPDYPASDPLITAVGGTTLEINRRGHDQNQYGWSTASQELCAQVTTTNCGDATVPTGTLGFNAGGGGGTSYTFAEPSYQVGVVPTDLANRNDEGAARVEPDISMDADAQSGLLIGLTQVFPNGTYYDQFKEGGTSLASPLLAGEVADTDQAALRKGNTVVGFLNPALYATYTADSGAYNDIVPPANADSADVIRVNYDDSTDATDGYDVFVRAIGYAGPETWCDATGNCATRPVTLTAAPGFDSLTGLGSVGPNFIRDLSQF